MAYTRPDGTITNFSLPAADYARPLGSATNFSFVVEEEPGLTFQPSDPYTLQPQMSANFMFDVPKTGTAEGFITGSFGTANSTANQSEEAAGFSSTAFGQPTYAFIAQASGFTSTTLGDTPRVITLTQATGWTGTAFGAPHVLNNAVGFSSTAFGTHAAPYSQAGEVTGWQVTAFGTPSQLSIGRASSFGPLVIIPGAFTRQDQTAVASGFTRTRFGPPIYRALPDITTNVVCTADGWLATSFGAPQSPYTQVAGAYGFSYTYLGFHRGYVAGPETVFGTPQSGTIHAAEGFALSVVGSPMSPYTAVGFTSATAGLPVGAASNTASGFCRTRMGNPWSAIKGHRVYTLRVPARFGRPKASLAFNRPVAGFGGAQFGTPDGAGIQRAMHTSPSASFGTAIVKRSPSC